MMEVKHSPAATQMEFRSSRNGLSENVEDELETLFEEGDSKSLPLKSDKCDEKLPILNGINKCPEEESPPKALDDIDAELDAKDAKDAKDVTEDSETFDLDLEPKGAEDTQNGEITDSSKVRDTGDDLDTLLSKINDLVEDCMDEPKTSLELKAKAENIVDIAKDDLDDVKEDKELSCEYKGSDKEPEENCDVPEEMEVDVKEEDSAENEDSVIGSGKCASDKMEVDDIVFCLDSPVDDSNAAEEKAPEEEESVDAPEGEAISDKKEEVNETKPPAVEETEQSKDPQQEDDDVFLIEDDDDDEIMMQADLAETEKDVTTKSEETQPSDGKELEKDSEKAVTEDTGSKDKDEAKVEDDGSKPVNEEDDDIVCLDDSLEEIEEKEGEPTEDTSENKDVASKAKTEEAEQEADKTSVSVMEKVSEEIEKDDAQKETAEEVVASKEEPEPTVEKVAAADKPIVPVSETKEISKDEKEDAAKVSKPSPVMDDDDIVILDDDDDQPEDTTPKESTTAVKTVDPPSSSNSCATTTDEAKASKEEKDESTVSEKAITAESAIISDNSDNARDGVEEKEDEAKLTSEPASVSTESNSASDSLLKESKAGEIEENNEQPPAKKIRLSQDESNSRLSIISQEETKSNTQDNDNDEPIEDAKALKRVRSSESLSADFKKPKTDADLEKVDVSSLKDFKEEVVKVESKPLPLYPPPKLDPPTIDLSLDFLKRFKKTIHKMTKSDLEELVLQKIVEAIVHKSEFSEMRELIEKQDKIISGHRTKITELNKQFRDLEMVHNRVLKDLETKNAQFVMPVKITRAVGLQVFFPAKKFDPTLAPLTPQNTTPVPPAHPSKSTSSLSTHPTDRPSHSSPAPSGSQTPKSSTTTSTSTQAASSSSNVQQQATLPQRRGCVQKLTPLRPDTPRNSPLNRSVSAGVVSSSTPSPSTSKDQSQVYHNRQVVQKVRVNSNAPVTANVSPKVPVTVVPSIPEPEKHKSAPTTPYSTSNKLVGNRGNKTITKFVTSDPQSISQPLPAAATIVSPAIPPSTGVSAIDTSKSGQKSVIDLTEEDDVIPPAPTYSSKTPSTPLAQVSIVPQPPVQQPGTRPYKVSIVPPQQLQQPRPNPPKPVQQRAVTPKPNGVAIRQVAAAPARYRHPAPLPNQPTHSSNPAWKLPPARPTIRISNLESGIVISWTIEDTAKEKYAESTSYQIYAYQETSGPPLVESWRHVGDVKAMLLPMAVTLTQFQEGQRYYFAVRAVDAHNRCGPFSFAKTWS